MKRIVLYALLFLGLLFGAAHVAMAAAGDIVLTAADELSSSLASTTFKFACTGGTVGSAVDGGANDADGTVNGTVRASAAFAQGGPDCDDGESFTTQTVEKDGYVTATASLVSYASGAENAAAVSLPYGFKVTVLTADNVAFHSAEVTAGQGSKIDCVESGDIGVYHCPIPVSDKNKVIKVDRDYFINTTGQFPASRSLNTDSQVTATITNVRYKKVEGISVAEAASANYLKKVSWTSTTDPNFSRYEIYGRRTEPGVTHLNGSWLASVFSVAADNAVVSSSGCGETNYFVVHAIDADGNRSIVSSEVSISAMGNCAALAPAPAAETVVPVEAVEEVVELAAEVVEESFETAEAVTQTEEAVVQSGPVSQEATLTETPATAGIAPPAAEAETAGEETEIPEERPVPPPEEPQRVAPDEPVLPVFLRVIPNTAAQIQANFQALYELFQQRVAQGVDLKESFRDNAGILTEAFRYLFGRR